jgi:hypothetical protein
MEFNNKLLFFLNTINNIVRGNQKRHSNYEQFLYYWDKIRRA